MNSARLESFTNRRSALIVGHPGHEIRVWGWMRAARPVVSVLTDGGGARQASRLHLTRQIVLDAGARISPWFGVLSDAEMYHAILGRNVSLFVRLADELATILVDEGIEVVVGDAAEGYNPTHDICRLVIDRAVRVARRSVAIESYSFGLVGRPIPGTRDRHCPCFELADEELALKIQVGRDYATTVGGTLLDEIDDLLARFGEKEFGYEYFMPAGNAADAVPRGTKPFYETYGERQVAAGLYHDVIRLDDHLTPIADALVD